MEINTCEKYVLSRLEETEKALEEAQRRADLTEQLYAQIADLRFQLSQARLENDMLKKRLAKSESVSSS